MTSFGMINARSLSSNAVVTMLDGALSECIRLITYPFSIHFTIKHFTQVAFRGWRWVGARRLRGQRGR